MPLLFDDQLHVHYGQFYVESETFTSNLSESMGGQSNGLCGAAVPGMLFLITGLHTGTVKLTVELLDAPPPLGDEWEEAVEVSFRPGSESVDLVQWAGEASWPLALTEIDYRVRYCATGMDAARAQDTRLDGEPLVDRYLLQLWPAPAAPDAVIRETSECAAYWHAHARTLPPPPTPEQKAEAKRRERLARERARKEAARAAEERRWGGRPPSDHLKRVNGGTTLARLDRDLVAGIEEADETTQHAVGRWVARRACAEAGLGDLDWVARALDALEGGEPLPFDLTEAFELLGTDARTPMTTVPSFDGKHDNVSQQYAALPALWSAATPDGLTAGVETLFHATVTFGSGYPRLFTEVREAFPALSH